jgi:PadR family transcriptional regulator, regulatory protein PadR
LTACRTFVYLYRLWRVTRERRPSPQTVAVVRALAAEPGTWRYGYELGVEVGLKAGSLYPILMRLTDRGLLEARWETDAPPGRPPRHLYRLTGAGLAFAATATAEQPAARPAPAAVRRPQPGLGSA